MEETDFSNVPQEIREKYSLPDQETIQRFVHGSLWLSNQEQARLQRKIALDYALIVSSMTVGLGSYIWLRTPTGVIARQEYEKTLSRPIRTLRRTLPFACAVVPLYLLRSAIHEVKIPGFSK